MKKRIMLLLVVFISINSYSEWKSVYLKRAQRNERVLQGSLKWLAPLPAKTKNKEMSDIYQQRVDIAKQNLSLIGRSIKPTNEGKRDAVDFLWYQLLYNYNLNSNLGSLGSHFYHLVILKTNAKKNKKNYDEIYKIYEKIDLINSLSSDKIKETIKALSKFTPNNK